MSDTVTVEVIVSALERIAQRCGVRGPNNYTPEVRTCAIGAAGELAAALGLTVSEELQTTMDEAARLQEEARVKWRLEI